MNPINFEKLNGLAPAIVQDSQTREVLMLGFMNEEALERTLSEKQVIFFSRSKGRLWRKGESSGNTLELLDIRADCDSDSLLILARPKGPTCHTGKVSCFGEGGFSLAKLTTIIKERKQKMPDGSYTSSLFDAGLEKISAKIEEEAEEVIRAAKSEGRKRVIEESADLLYHLLVLLTDQGIGLDEVEGELAKRRG